MAVQVRQEKRKDKTRCFIVTVRLELPDGRLVRERRRVKVATKGAARRWGEEREDELLRHGGRKFEQAMPTVAEFWPRYISGHARANQQAPSTIAAKLSIYKAHLEPLFAHKRLDTFSDEDVARLKSMLSNRAAKTINNVLTVLSGMLRTAHVWSRTTGLHELPVRIKLLRVQRADPKFYDFDEYRSLRVAARRQEPRIYAAILLGGDAGLRDGEIRELRWQDIRFERNLLSVRRKVWRSTVGDTKGKKVRHVPMTPELADALRALRHLRGELVLTQENGRRVSRKLLSKWMRKAQASARLEKTGNLHILRHTFCSHLAMKGRPALEIMELAGHESISTSEKYMHLAKSSKTDAIAALGDRENEKSGPRGLPQARQDNGRH